MVGVGQLPAGAHRSRSGGAQPDAGIDWAAGQIGGYLRTGRDEPQSLGATGTPTDARILNPMAELIADDEILIVHLTPGEKILSVHGDIRVRLSSVVCVAPDPKPWLGLRGWRMAGVSVAGHVALGTRRHGAGYDFCILHRDRPAVRVDTASGRFSRLIICVPDGGDPEAEAARIAAAAGIAASAPVGYTT
jgi:hypothetical protein